MKFKCPNCGFFGEEAIVPDLPNENFCGQCGKIIRKEYS